MDRVTVERMSRVIPYSAVETAYARRRPVHERTPLPKVGDDVLCRLVEWEDPYPAVVESVQPADDVDDPHLFEAQQDGRGDFVMVEGRLVLSEVDDPWPTLWLVVDAPGGRVHTHTREARLRGSAGWLPLDWRTRRRYLPHQLDALVTED